MTEAEKILNKFIKGDIARDYDEASRKHHTITLKTALEAINVSLNKPNVSGQLPLETKLEMFYDFLYERGIANQLGVGIDTVVKHFIDDRLSGNAR